MTDLNTFKDGEIVRFKLGSEGELYIAKSDPLGLDRGSIATATIERVDVDTKTIYFTAPLPKALDAFR